MNKESAPEELVGAVRKAIAGGRYISAALADKMASLLTNDTPGAPHESLSDREFLILNLIAAGKSVSVIARELSLSVKTVSTYRGRVLEKMGMSNNAELVHYAFQNRLVKDRPHDPSQPAAAARPPPAPSRERRAAAPTSSRSRSPHPFNS
jgi:DNA-binding NarL/FixJ family response regulator